VTVRNVKLLGYRANSDGAKVNNVRFENIRVEEARRLASVWIGKAVWSGDAERGHVSGVRFADIKATGEKPRIELKGFDERHLAEGVTFENVMINGAPLAPAGVEANAFVRDVTVRPKP